LYSDSIFGTGIYLFDYNEKKFNDVKTIFRDNSSRNEKIYCLSNTGLNNLEIVFFDTTSHILSGTFSLTLVDTLSFDSISINQGRFDIKYK
jgi:hypothetical protein